MVANESRNRPISARDWLGNKRSIGPKPGCRAANRNIWPGKPPRWPCPPSIARAFSRWRDLERAMTGEWQEYFVARMFFRGQTEKITDEGSGTTRERPKALRRFTPNILANNIPAFLPPASSLPIFLGPMKRCVDISNGLHGRTVPDVERLRGVRSRFLLATVKICEANISCWTKPSSQDRWCGVVGCEKMQGQCRWSPEPGTWTWRRLSHGKRRSA